MFRSGCLGSRGRAVSVRHARPSSSEAGAAPLEQALEDTISAIRDGNVPWYELVALEYDSATGDGGVLNVGIVLAANAAISAAGQPFLPPVLEMLKTLVDFARTAAHLRQDVLETVEYCVTISKYVVQACTRRELPPAVHFVADDLVGDMRDVMRLARRVASPTCCIWQLISSEHDKTVLDKLKQKLMSKLKLMERALAIAFVVRPTPLPRATGLVFGEAPTLPKTYVKRSSDTSVVLDVIDPRHPAPWCHCVWGMGGVGKSFLASSVAHDDRILSSFEGGVFWISVGNDVTTEDKRLVLLRRLAALFAQTLSSEVFHWPDHFLSVDDVTDHLKRARGGRRCLVVLDDVWHEEVTDSFAATGFHLLVTSRRRSALSRRWPGALTEVLHMEDEEALELLRQASGAAGPLPEHEAMSVAKICGRLPLALSMAGRLGREDPLNPTFWRERVLDSLRDKYKKFKEKKISEDGGVLFPVIDVTFDRLPERQQQQFKLMVVVAPGILVATEMMACLWNTAFKGPEGAVEEDARIDIKVLADNSLLHESSGAYRLHDLTHEYLQLLVEMSGGVLSLATHRQATFLAMPETLQMYASNNRGTRGDLYSLVKLWVALGRLGSSTSVWEYMKQVPEATRDEAYMREGGELLILMGEYAEAEIMLKHLLSREEAAAGSSVQRSTLKNVGWSLQAQMELATWSIRPSQGKNEEAETLFRRALEITEATLGENDPTYSADLNNLAKVLKAQGEYSKAEPLFRRAMEILRASCGRYHWNYSIILNNLARLLQAQERFEEAETMYRQALELTEVTWGKDHPTYSSELNNLAGLLELQGKSEEAESLYRRAMEIADPFLDGFHRDSSTGWGERLEFIVPVFGRTD